LKRSDARNFKLWDGSREKASLVQREVAKGCPQRLPRCSAVYCFAVLQLNFLAMTRNPQPAIARQASRDFAERRQKTGKPFLL